MIPGHIYGKPNRKKNDKLSFFIGSPYPLKLQAMVKRQEDKILRSVFATSLSYRQNVMLIGKLPCKIQN